MSIPNKRIVIYINKKQLRQLLQDELFVAYAPLPGGISGGEYNNSNVFFQLRKSVQA